MPANDFLQLAGKNILICGVANRKSVAWLTAKVLEEAGARVIYAVRSQARRESLSKLLGERPVYICDMEEEQQIQALADSLRTDFGELHGVVHSIAFANYSEGWKPFHETVRKDFLQAAQISAFSLVELSRYLKPILHIEASVVAISISSHTITAENYGYMSPIKSALDGIVRNLAKSFSKDSRIRFNTVNPSLLKTSASAGIPGYLESYLYGEKLTLRKQAVNTDEVANTVAFLLSPRSSGINAQGIVINAGMDNNYFDEEVIRLALRP